jgi:hypothetical protein
VKRGILYSIGIAVMALAIAFSLLQLKVPVAKADGCPDMGCGCTLQYSLWWMDNGTEHGECHYQCECCDCWPSGGADNFLIERDYSY